MAARAAVRTSLRPTRRQAVRAFSSTASTRFESLMDPSIFTESQHEIRAGIADTIKPFDNAYWREHDYKGIDPDDFHMAVAKGGWLGVALPEKFGGSGLGLAEACAMMQTVSESGGGFPAAQATHGNIYATQPLGIFGTDEQRATMIPKIVSGEWRTCFGVTEPNTGLNTLELKTTATRQSDGTWKIKGQKIWITCAQNAQLMILLARTTPLEELERKSKGLTLFAIPLDKSPGSGLEMKRITKMGGRCVDSNEIFFDDYVVPADSVIGGDKNIGNGFKMILHGMNAERCLIGAEALGIGYAALGRAAKYAKERVVFGRPIGQNQGVAHPLADAYMNLHAATLAVYHGAQLYDRLQAGDPSVTEAAVGAAANSAKYLGAEAGFNCAQRAILAHGGMGYAAEYDVERWFRESLVPRLAPISREMMMNYISERVLGLPKSY